MHSGNWTELNWTVQFSSVSHCALNWRRPAIRDKFGGRRRTQVRHNRGTLSWSGQSIIGRKPATSWNDWQRPSPVLDCQEHATAFAGRHSSSPVQCTAENWTELNSTQLNWSIQFSSVEFTSVQLFRCALGFTTQKGTSYFFINIQIALWDDIATIAISKFVSL